MTQIELRDSLMDRVGWKQPLSPPFQLNLENTTTLSGRYFQDEHPFVKIENIVAVAEIKLNVDSFNAYFKDLKKTAIMLVITDVFKTIDILPLVKDDILDDCISKRMAIVIGEAIYSSTRSNRIETIAKDFNEKLFFEINGSQGNPNFPNYVGIKSRYGMCVKQAQSILSQEPALDTFTFRL